MPEIKLIVDEDNVDKRLDVYLKENTSFSRSEIQRFIEEGNVLLNGTIPNKKIKTELNDEVIINYEEVVESDIEPENIHLDIIYEDDDLIVINKPKGMVVHPDLAYNSGTLVNALLYHFKTLSDVNGKYRAGIVHRIDKNTSGLIVCAKNNEAHKKLAEQLADKTCFRKYYAIVKGTFEHDEGEIDAPIGRNPNNRQMMAVTAKNSKQALTLFKVIERYSDSTLLDVELKTGRTHQIRVHMKYINHPVLNDNVYSKKVIDETGQYLHAYYLSFIHPITNERMEFMSAMPEYMKKYIKSQGGDFYGYKRQ